MDSIGPTGAYYNLQLEMGGSPPIIAEHVYSLKSSADSNVLGELLADLFHTIAIASHLFSEFTVNAGNIVKTGVITFGLPVIEVTIQTSAQGSDLAEIVNRMREWQSFQESE